jgi:hypothetical protein
MCAANALAIAGIFGLLAAPEATTTDRHRHGPVLVSTT